MPGRNEIAAGETPNVLHARVVSLQRQLDAMPPKLASGVMDNDAAVTAALSGLTELAGVVEALMKDYQRRF